MADLKAFDADQRRRSAVAAAEWEALAPLPPFRFAAEAVGAWAAGVAAQTGAGAPLTRHADWARALGARDGASRTEVVDHLLAAAVRDGIIVAPEPGVVAAAYAHRDPESERETAVGFGWRPAAARELRVRARTPVPWEVLADDAVAGAAALEQAIRAIAATLADVERGV